MKSIFITIFLTICLLTSGQTKKDTINDTDKTAIEHIKDYDNLKLSFISLIANPEKYDKQRVQIVGYLKLEFETNAIYMHKEDYRYGLLANSFRVEFSKDLLKKKDPKFYSDKFVIIIGTFNKFGGDLQSGTIEDIVRLDLWEIDRESKK